MSKVRVILDVDGVLADFVTPAVELINSLSGTDHKVTDVHTWELYQDLGVPFHIEETTREIMQSEGWCASLKPYPEAIPALHKLDELGAEIIIATSPLGGRHWMADRTEWLQDVLSIPHFQVIHTHLKGLLRADIFVDDRHTHCTAWVRENPEGSAFWWQPPYVATNPDRNWDRVITEVARRKNA